MKKLLTFLTLLTLSIGVSWAAETVTYQMGKGKPSSWSPGNSSGANTCVTDEGFTISFTSSNANRTDYIGWNSGNTTMTVSHETYKLTSITATCSNGNTNYVSVSNGGGSITKQESTYFQWDNAEGTTSVSFKYGNASGLSQLHISQLYIVYETGTTVEKYSITVNQPDEGGQISADKAEAAEGATVTLTATPDLGYELDSWTVLDGNADEVTVTNNQFTMPASDVEVSATFSKTWNNIITNVIPVNCGGGIWVYSGTEFGGVKKAQVGDDIYIRVVTDENNTISFEELTITDANNNTINYEPNGTDGWIWKDGRYGAEFKFVMPATAVTITAQYSVTRGTLRLAGRFNGNTGWRTTGTDEPAFTYDSSSDTYTIDAYFTGEGDGNYFYLTYDGAAKHPTANGNWSVQNTDGQATALTWSGNANFFIENGVFTIELPGNLSTIAFTKKNPTITFNPAAGAVESGTEISAESNLTDFISSIKAGDAGAQGEVSVKLCTDNSSFNLDNVTITEPTTVYGKAWIGNIVTPISDASYTIKTIETVTPTYEESFSENFGKFTPDDETIWTIGSTSSASFAKATAYNTGLQPIESYLISPYINLTNCSNPKVSFSHAGNYFSNQENMMADVKVMIKKQSDAGWTPLNDVTYPNGKSWTFVDNETSLIGYAGEIIQIAFKYTAPEDRAGTWEIKNFKVEDAELTYTVTCVGTPSNGVNQFTTDKEEYEAGETVTITVSPKNGFELTSLSYTPEGGTTTTIALTEGQTEYTFQMPAANVAVNATFTALSYGITVVSDHGTHNCPTTGTTLSPISFTVEPEDGYVISSVTANPTTVAVTVSGNDISFIMPAVPVTLTINYTQQSSGTAIDLFHETFGDNSGKARDWNDSYSVKSGVLEVYSNVNYTVTDAKQSKNTMGYGSESSALVSGQGATGVFIVGPLAVSNYTELEVTNYFGMSSSSWAETSFMKLSYSTDNSTYTEVSREGSNPSGAVGSNRNHVLATYSLPSAAESNNLYLKFEFYCYQVNKSGVQIGQAYFDEVNLAGVQKSVEPEPESKTLAELCGGEGIVSGNVYTIADENGLLGVYKSADGKTVWFKDDNNAIDKQPTGPDTQNFEINDENGNQKNTEDFDQSNWIEVDFSNVDIPAEVAGQEPNVYIKNLTGIFTNENGNPKLVLTKAPAEVNPVIEEAQFYVPNPYIPAHFGTVNGGYFFSKPKAQEYAYITLAAWDGEKMNVPTTMTGTYGFTGSFSIVADQAILDDLKVYDLNAQNEADRGLTYSFHAIIRKAGSASPAPRLKVNGEEYEVLPTDLTSATVPTAISTIETSNGEVKSVKYVNVAGVVSDRPFQGVNIVVTEYTDGSRTTTKVVK